MTSLSVTPAVHHVTSPSVTLSIYHVTHPSIDLSICHATCLYVDTSIHTALCPSAYLSLFNCLYAIFTSLSDCLSLPDHLYDNSTSPADCPSMSDHLYTVMTGLFTHLLSIMTKHLHNSSQSLAVLNGSNPTGLRNSVGPFLAYDLLLCDLDTI